MKYLKLILISVILNGCEKCMTCTSVTTLSSNPPGVSYKQTFTACGDQLSSVNGKTTITTASSGGIIQTTTTCQ